MYKSINQSLILETIAKAHEQAVAILALEIFGRMHCGMQTFDKDHTCCPCFSSFARVCVCRWYCEVEYWLFYIYICFVWWEYFRTWYVGLPCTSLPLNANLLHCWRSCDLLLDMLSFVPTEWRELWKCSAAEAALEEPERCYLFLAMASEGK